MTNLTTRLTHFEMDFKTLPKHASPRKPSCPEGCGNNFLRFDNFN